MTEIANDSLKNMSKQPFQPQRVFNLWCKRIRNIIPSMTALKKGASFCISKLTNICKNLKKDMTETMASVKQVWRTVNAFSPYKIKTTLSKATNCPLNEKPLIVKIESFGNGKRHSHGGAIYDGIVVDSDGDGKNTTNTGKLDKPEMDATASYFVLYPSRLGLNPSKLASAMKKESTKTDDYDFYINNCIDHVIRPLKEAGASIDFGKISTPKELCIWCDKMCHQNNAGYLLNETEYQALLKRIDKEKGMQSKNLQFMNALAKLNDKQTHPSLEERTSNYPIRFHCGSDNLQMPSMEKGAASFKKQVSSGQKNIDTQQALIHNRTQQLQASL